jgi:hypothetical protein
MFERGDIGVQIVFIHAEMLEGIKCLLLFSGIGKCGVKCGCIFVPQLVFISFYLIHCACDFIVKGVDLIFDPIFDYRSFDKRQGITGTLIWFGHDLVGTIECLMQLEL